MVQRIKLEKLDTMHEIYEGVSIVTRGGTLSADATTVNDRNSGLYLFYIRDCTTGLDLRLNPIANPIQIGSLGLTDISRIREFSASWRTIKIPMLSKDGLNVMNFKVWNPNNITELFITSSDLVILGKFIEVRIKLHLVDLNAILPEYKLTNVSKAYELHYA